MISDKNVKVCPVCGKTFLAPEPEVWAYKCLRYQPARTLFFCSWHCLRKEEAENEAIKARRHEEWCASVKEAWKKRRKA